MHDLTLANSKIARCQQIKADGVQCNLPAVGGRTLCHRHELVHRNIAHPSSYSAPVVHVEDAASLQLALNDVIARLIRGQIDRRDAALIIRSLRAILATMRLEHKAPADAFDMVRDYSKVAKHVDWKQHMSEEERANVKNAVEDEKWGFIRSQLALLKKQQLAKRRQEAIERGEDMYQWDAYNGWEQPEENRADAAPSPDPQSQPDSPPEQPTEATPPQLSNARASTDPVPADTQHTHTPISVVHASVQQESMNELAVAVPLSRLRNTTCFVSSSCPPAGRL